MEFKYCKDGFEFVVFTYDDLRFLYDIAGANLFSISEEEYAAMLNLITTDRSTDLASAVLEKLNSVSKSHPITIEKHSQSVKSVAIEVSNDCNMRCAYCYGDGGTYGQECCYMACDTAEKCIDYLIAHSNGAKHLSVIFFGGEPLLNLPVVKHIIDYCHAQERIHELKFTYSITTNATIINDEIIQLLRDNRFSVTISIDGPKDVHDHNRYYKNHGGSYDHVKKNVDRLLEAGIRLHARATVNSIEPRLSALYDHLSNMGFHAITLSFVNTSPSSSLYISDEVFPLIYNEIHKLGNLCIQEILTTGNVKFTMFRILLMRIYRHAKFAYSCGCGAGYLAFTAKGELYPCHRFSNWEKYRLGNMNEENISHREFLYCNVETRPECTSCAYRYLCSGTCIHSAALSTGTIFGTDTHYCELYHDLIRTSMYIYTVVSEKNPSVWEKMFPQR